jgi:hypothetical protein
MPSSSSRNKPCQLGPDRVGRRVVPTASHRLGCRVHMTAEALHRLSDRELIAVTVRVAADERRSTVELGELLAELDARRLYLGQGCSSLFTYCTEVLRLSESAAYNRIEAARAIRLFPLIGERLRDGSMTLTTVALLRPQLTLKNHGRLIDEARHKSKREVEQQIARLAPKPDVPTLIRRLPDTAVTSSSLATPREAAVSNDIGTLVPPTTSRCGAERTTPTKVSFVLDAGSLRTSADECRPPRAGRSRRQRHRLIVFFGWPRLANPNASGAGPLICANRQLHRACRRVPQEPFDDRTVPARRPRRHSSSDLPVPAGPSASAASAELDQCDSSQRRLPGSKK